MSLQMGSLPQGTGIREGTVMEVQLAIALVQCHSFSKSAWTRAERDWRWPREISPSIFYSFYSSDLQDGKHAYCHTSD